MKNIITEVPSPVLQYYDPAKPVKVQVDASQTGLGAVIMQNGKPIAYASKVLTTTQQTYAQIEKENLAIVFGCEKFHHYLYGRDFLAETAFRDNNEETSSFGSDEIATDENTITGITSQFNTSQGRIFL